MNIDGNEVIQALKNQRNSSQDENAQLFAMVSALNKEIAILKAKPAKQPRAKKQPKTDDQKK